MGECACSEAPCPSSSLSLFDTLLLLLLLLPYEVGRLIVLRGLTLIF